MKCIILGAGSIGFQIAKALIPETKEIILIEKNQATIDYVSSKLDCMIIRGGIPTPSMLEEIGIEDTDFYIATTDSDEINMISCGMVASRYSKPVTIARIRNIEYNIQANLIEKNFLNIDYLINPDLEVAEAVSRSIEYGTVSDVMYFEYSDMQIRNCKVDVESPLVDMNLRDIRKKVNIPFLFTVVLRDGDVHMPEGDFVVRENDLLYIAAHPEHFPPLFDFFGKPRKMIKRILIIGGGRIGLQIGRYLTDNRPKNLLSLIFNRKSKVFGKVTILERDYERCQYLADEIPNALVVHGDFSDEEVFDDLPFSSSELVIAVTDNQELNIIATVYAKTLGVDRSIALVLKNNYADVASRLGIDVVMSKKSTVVNSMLRIIRGAYLHSLHTISNGQVEVFECTVAENAPVVGRPLHSIDELAGMLVVAVSQEGNKSIIPDGAYIIKPNERVVVLAKREYIDRSHMLFSGREA